MTKLLSLRITLWICIQRDKTPHKAPALVWDLAELLPSWWGEPRFCHAIPFHPIQQCWALHPAWTCQCSPFIQGGGLTILQLIVQEADVWQWKKINEQSRESRNSLDGSCGEVQCPDCACVHSREPVSSAAGLIYCGQH